MILLVSPRQCGGETGFCPAGLSWTWPPRRARGMAPWPSSGGAAFEIVDPIASGVESFQWAFTRRVDPALLGEVHPSDASVGREADGDRPEDEDQDSRGHECSLVVSVAQLLRYASRSV